MPQLLGSYTPNYNLYVLTADDDFEQALLAVAANFIKVDLALGTIPDVSVYALATDPRFSDERVPADGSVTPAKLAFVVATPADIEAHRVDTTDVHGIPDTAALVVTTDPRLADQRVPPDSSVTPAKLSFDPATQVELNDQVAALQLADAARLQWRGAWAAATTYAVNDIFTNNGGLYRVPVAFTSGAVFDATGLVVLVPPFGTYALGAAFVLQADGTGTRSSNIIHKAEPTNAIASDLGACSIHGGGQPGYNNIIGGDGSTTVNTSTPNVVSAATGAHYSTIFAGYDNVAGGLASVIGGMHCYTGLTTTHGSIGGGSVNSIAAGDYNRIGGGTANQITAGNSSVIPGGTTNTCSANTCTVGGGTGNVASQTSATVVGGQGNTANGIAATVMGRDNSATIDYATVMGRDATGKRYGAVTQASGKFTNQGDAQASRLTARKQTTNATQTELFLDGSANRDTLSSNTAMCFRIRVVGRQSTTGDCAAYEFVGAIKRASTNASCAFVGTPTQTVIGEDQAAWDATVVADTTNGALVVKVTGEASKTIDWVALIDQVEVTF